MGREKMQLECRPLVVNKPGVFFYGFCMFLFCPFWDVMACACHCSPFCKRCYRCF